MFGSEKENMHKEIHPIPHDRGSAFNTMAGSTAGEGLKGAGKGALNGIIVGAVVLGSIAFLLSPIGFPMVASAIGSVGALFGGGAAAGGGISAAGLITAAMVGIGATIGALKGLGIGGVIGGGLGMFKGAKDGHGQVQQERAAAMQVQHQLGAVQAENQAIMSQAEAIGHRNAAHAHSPYPQQGSPMNMASSKINAADIAEHSRVADMQLQRA